MATINASLLLFTLQVVMGCILSTHSHAAFTVTTCASNRPTVFTARIRGSARTLQARRRPEDETPFYNDEDDDDNDEDYDYYDEDDTNNEYYQRRSAPTSRRRSRRPSRPNFTPIDDLGESGINVPSPFGRRSGLRLPDSVSKALLAGVFVLGIGTGVTVDSAINTNPRDLASRDAIDQSAPNPTVCARYGASAMAFDQRVFVSFNPFNVYVAQADVKPACVLRQSNIVSVLQERKLINDDEVRACKRNMNTWAFVGDLDDMPQLSCVYKSEDAQNEFLSNPKLGIGEDVYDDDRARAAAMAARGAGKRSTGKMVKDSMTEAQLKKQIMANEEVKIP